MSEDRLCDEWRELDVFFCQHGQHVDVWLAVHREVTQ